MAAGLVLVFAQCGSTQAAELPGFPAPAAPVVEVAQLQRFLALATTPAEQAPPVRVLFYGQSIIEQWWQGLADTLRARFPGASLAIQSASIGGYPSSFLLKTAEADVYPFQPDLIVFHAYDDGAWANYAELLRRFRARTCADIVVVGNHLAGYDALDEDTLMNGVPPSHWPGMAAADHLYIPRAARESGACRADVRTPWKEYLRQNALDPQELRVDIVHLNDAGARFVVGLLEPYFEPRLFTPPIDPYDCGRVTRSRLNGRTVIPFVGNRVLLAASGPGGAAFCRIDGLRPSEIPALYYHTRCTGWPKTWRPSLLKVGSSTRPVVEDWVLTVEEVQSDGGFTYSVAGSVTGTDGSGWTGADFVSTSGRVTIQAADWCWAAYSGGLAPGFQIHWSTRLRGSDLVRGEGAWRWVEVAAGLDDGPHTLSIEILEGDPGAFPEVLLYHPVGSDAGGYPDLHVRQLQGDGTVLLRWADHPGSALWSSTDLNSWAVLPPAEAGFGWAQALLSTSAPGRFFRLAPVSGAR